MRAIVQRVTNSSVIINSNEERKSGKGLVVLLGIGEDDTNNDLEWLSNKIVNLRVFSDDKGKMNRSILDIKGDILLISQFTLFASYKKGNRPSFIRAAKPEKAIPLYNLFAVKVQQKINGNVVCGEFGAHMDVQLVNNGPVTIFMDSKHPE